MFPSHLQTSIHTINVEILAEIFDNEISQLGDL